MPESHIAIGARRWIRMFFHRLGCFGAHFLSCCIHSVILKHQKTSWSLVSKTYKLFWCKGTKISAPLATTKKKRKNTYSIQFLNSWLLCTPEKRRQTKQKRMGGGAIGVYEKAPKKNSRISDLLDGFSEMPRLQLKCLDCQHYHSPGGGSTKICG